MPLAFASVMERARDRELDPSKIRDLVQRLKVCWEVHPERAVVAVMDPKQNAVSTKLRNIGYSLELYGTPEPGAEQFLPGSNPFRRVESALKEIAGRILPREEGPCIFEVQVDTQSLFYSLTRGDRPDVRVSIHILHRNKWDQPVDECQKRCLNRMEHALAELGACEGAWNP